MSIVDDAFFRLRMISSSLLQYLFLFWSQSTR